MEVSQFDPRATLEDLLRVFRVAAHRTVIDSNVSAAELPPLLRGDCGHWAQVVANLVSNATKFCGGGTVRLDVKVSDAPEDASAPPPAEGGGSSHGAPSFASRGVLTHTRERTGADYLFNRRAASGPAPGRLRASRADARLRPRPLPR